jgi:hypothetical protein
VDTILEKKKFEKGAIVCVSTFYRSLLISKGNGKVKIFGLYKKFTKTFILQINRLTVYEEFTIILLTF